MGGTFCTQKARRPKKQAIFVASSVVLSSRKSLKSFVRGGGRVRSGRRGRRFKSCHSDQYIKYLAAFPIFNATKCAKIGSVNSMAFPDFMRFFDLLKASGWQAGAVGQAATHSDGAAAFEKRGSRRSNRQALNQQPRQIDAIILSTFASS
jgi:hypothetical protein